jgi:hypothetical protein
MPEFGSCPGVGRPISVPYVTLLEDRKAIQRATAVLSVDLGVDENGLGSTSCELRELAQRFRYFARSNFSVLALAIETAVVISWMSVRDGPATATARKQTRAGQPNGYARIGPHKNLRFGDIEAVLSQRYLAEQRRRNPLVSSCLRAFSAIPRL